MAKTESLSMNMKIGLGIFVLIILIGGFYIFSGSNGDSSSATTSSQSSSPAVTNPSSYPNAPSSTASNHIITIQNSQFSDTDITIGLGENITWINKESTVHGIHIKTATQDLQHTLQNKDSRYTYVFTSKGTYNFYDDYHPDLKGTVTVV